MTDRRMFTAIPIVLAVLLLAGCAPSAGELEVQWRIRPFSVTNTPGAPATATMTPTATPAVETTAIPTVTPTPRPTATPGTPQNLLVNAGFEGAFTEREMGVTVAVGWEPLYRQGDGEPDWELLKPEWKPAAPYEDRIHSGANAQQWFGFYSTIDGGVYQVVGLTTGRTYRLSFWGLVWSSAYDDPEVSEAPGQDGWCVRHGQDVDALEHEYCWLLWEKNTPIPEGAQEVYYDEWNLFEYEFVAETANTVVYIGGRNFYPVKHNDFYLDDASLVEVGGGGASSTTLAAPTQEAVEQVTPVVYLNLRAGPGDDYDVLRVLAPGEVCIFVGVDRTGDWYNVECDGSLGWSWGEYLEAYLQGAHSNLAGRKESAGCALLFEIEV